MTPLADIQATGRNVDCHLRQEVAQELLWGHQNFSCWSRDLGCYGQAFSYRYSTSSSPIYFVQGNKGGTAIRVVFTPPPNSSAEKSALRSPGPTSLTFVNAHLAAFDEMTDKRNSDFQELSRRLGFEGVEPSSFPMTPSPNADGSDDRVNMGPPTSPDSGPPTTSVYETDVLFWMVSFLFFQDSLSNLISVTCREVCSISRPLNSNMN